MWHECIIQEYTVSIVNITRGAVDTANDLLLVGTWINISVMERKTTVHFSQVLSKTFRSKAQFGVQTLLFLFLWIKFKSKKASLFLCLLPSFALDTYHLECIFITRSVNTHTFEAVFLFFPLALQYDF